MREMGWSAAFRAVQDSELLVHFRGPKHEMGWLGSHLKVFWFCVLDKDAFGGWSFGVSDFQAG